jgi:hypothetical protein
MLVCFTNSRRACCVALLVVAMGAVFAAGCATREKLAESKSTANSAAAGSVLTEADVDSLCGKPWVGGLTYLDYQSKKETTIDSSLIVKRVGTTPAAWEFGVGYSKEPHADAKETVALSPDGRMLGDERVISREALPDGGVRFVTEATGQDDNRPARFRFEHTITANEYTRRKLVCFEGESEFFQRHIYRWAR